jgi:hypothetical protein
VTGHRDDSSEQIGRLGTPGHRSTTPGGGGGVRRPQTQVDHLLPASRVKTSEGRRGIVGGDTENYSYSSGGEELGGGGGSMLSHSMRPLHRQKEWEEGVRDGDKLQAQTMRPSRRKMLQPLQVEILKRQVPIQTFYTDCR